MADDGEDQISKLPIHLIHHILSFLPMEDIIQMRCVSKYWESMWIGVPVLNFKQFTDDSFVKMAEDLKLWPSIDKSSLRDISPQMFVNFVDNCVYRRHNASSEKEFSVTRFKLYLDSLDGSFIPAARIDEWLNSVHEMRVKELYLCIKPFFPRPLCSLYCFPETALNNAGLTVLKLEGIRLETTFLISLPSLTTLSVIDVFFEAETFQNLISGCPNIKDLELSGYIKDESGEYGGSLSGVDLTVCVALRSLSLIQSEFTNQWLEHLTFGLPLLERFTLDSCCCSRNFNIHSQSLKSFYYFFGDLPDVFDDLDDFVVKVALNTPNLVYFYCEGYMGVGFFINSANLLEADLVVWSNYGEKTMYRNLLSLLSNLNCSSSTTVRLHVDCAKALLIPEDIKEMFFSPLPDLKHLRVKIHEDCDFSRDSELKEALLWCAPSVETLEIGSCSCLALKKGCEKSA